VIIYLGIFRNNTQKLVNKIKILQEQNAIFKKGVDKIIQINKNKEKKFELVFELLNDAFNKIELILDKNKSLEIKIDVNKKELKNIEYNIKLIDGKLEKQFNSFIVNNDNLQKRDDLLSADNDNLGKQMLINKDESIKINKKLETNFRDEIKYVVFEGCLENFAQLNFDPDFKMRFSMTNRPHCLYSVMDNGVYKSHNDYKYFFEYVDKIEKKNNFKLFDRSCVDYKVPELKPDFNQNGNNYIITDKNNITNIFLSLQLTYLSIEKHLHFSHSNNIADSTQIFKYNESKKYKYIVEEIIYGRNNKYTYCRKKYSHYMEISKSSHHIFIKLNRIQI